MSRWAVVLAGGVGSRFWPLSTPERPKQLLPLVSDQPMLREAVERLSPLVPVERVLVLTNASLAPAVAALVPALPPENVVAEPRAGGTAAALTWAAHEIARRGGPADVMISVHADWSIGDPAAFRATLARATESAEAHASLVTVGVVPSRVDPGFGYIEPGDLLADGARRVARFVEKPSRERAADMIEAGYLWNSGIFVWRAGDLLEEVAALTPEVGPALAAHPDDLGAFFAAVTPVSVDVGVLERSGRVLVLPGSFGWDDVGTWAALRRVRPADEGNNATSGPVHLLDATGNVVYTDGNPVVLYGVSDLVVVSRAGLSLVTTIERSTDLKTLLDSLPASLRERP
ncbi:MAG TPA: sugar phosphate nucleotidyltransferase [Gemmatimonadaceae bacterium]|nr:sugar phosphate nucleotidyltransferase [Gemmatimonadaceae bacterium]